MTYQRKKEVPRITETGVFLISRSRGEKTAKREIKDGSKMSLHVSGHALNYNEGRKSSLVMVPPWYIIITVACGAERERERGVEGRTKINGILCVFTV